MDEEIERCLEALVENDDWDIAPEWKQLICALDDDPAIRLAFKGKHHLIGHERYEFDDLEALAEELLGWARIIGAITALSDLRLYLQEDSYEAWDVLLLAGPRIEFESNLADDVRIVPRSSLPGLELKRLSPPPDYWAPLPEITGALLRKVSLKKQVLLPEDPPTSAISNKDHEVLEALYLCLGLARTGGCPFQAVARAIVPVDIIPLKSSSSWYLREFRRPPNNSPPFLAVEAQWAAAAYSKYSILEKRGRLRVAMDRVLVCAVVSDPVEKAIALRTGLEALFLDDNIKVELSYRLGLRAAFLMFPLRRNSQTSELLEKRREIKKLINDVYRFTSEAVHGGEFSKDYWKSGTGPAKIEAGIELLRKAILMRMNHQDPWQEIELSGGMLAEDTSPTPSG